MAQNNDAIELINQAKSQARNEKIREFLNKNSRLLKRLATVLAVVAVVFAVFTLIQNSRQEKFSAILHQSLIDQQLGNLKSAKENLKTIYEAKSAPSGVHSLASLRYAAFVLEEGNKAEAAKIYEEVSKCFSCDSYIKDLAGLLAVRTWLIDENELKKEGLAKRIEKIENSNKSLKYQVAEQRALLEMQRNNLEKSYSIFELIAKSPESSDASKARAKDGLKMIISKGFEPKDEMKEEEK
jgi:hypothetical protein